MLALNDMLALKQELGHGQGRPKHEWFRCRRPVVSGDGLELRQEWHNESLSLTQWRSRSS